MFFAQEGIEGGAAQGADDLDSVNVLAVDFVVGLAASGRTPYVLGAVVATDWNINAAILKLAGGG